MKPYRLLIALFGLFMILSFSGCGGGSGGGDSEGTGTLSLNLADAPIDDDNISGVYITITEIQYHSSDGGWKTMDEFNNTRDNPYNLLEWQDGKSISLGDFEMPSGKYTQIRFILDVPEKNGHDASNPGCYITYNDGRDNEPLYVASGSNTGYKAIGNYEVPINGDVNITADFDVRKSVIETGNGQFKLKPTIRLVANNEAGTIKGNITNMTNDLKYVVYAYEDDTWNASTEEYEFPNAINSALVKDESTNTTTGNYTLSFLAEGTYDLIIDQNDGDNGGHNLYIREDVEVKSEETTTVDLDISTLDPAPSTP